jgi:hypothetical protein
MRSVLVWQSGLLRMLVDDPSSLRLPVYKEAVRAIGSLAGSPALLPLPSPDDAPDTARLEASAAEARVRFGLSLMAQELIVAFRLPHPRPRHQRRAPGAGEPQTRQVSQARQFIRGASEPAAAGMAAAVTAVAEGLEAAEDAEAAEEPLQLQLTAETVATLSALLIDRRCVGMACPSLAELRALLKLVGQRRTFREMVPALGAPDTALAPNKAGIPGGFSGVKAHAPRKITPTCTAQGATAAASASSALLATAAPGGFGAGFGAGGGAGGSLGGGSPDSPAISPTLARILSSSRWLPAFPQPDGTPSALGPSAAREATPSAGRASYGEVSAVERLQELQHAPFWRQQRELFGAVNALLEPLVQTVCTDATLALAQRLPSLAVRPGCLPPSQRALLQAALTEAHAHAGARLDTALRALLPRGAPS